MENIVYKHDADGAFICGDKVTGATSYSYPTSTNAVKARRNPLKVAKAALVRDYRGAADIVAMYDKRNWALLNAE